MSDNSNLSSARRKKNDEFYTRIEDIEVELRHYKQHLKGKVVYCPCDNPAWSSFYLYFEREFEALGLKGLVTTHYVQGGKSFKREYTGEQAVDTPLEGDGDFRSEECKAILREVDVVVTNPPFSLFRKFVVALTQAKKQFLIVGSMNAITYKVLFSLIKDDNLWLGVNSIKQFIQPDGSTKKFGNICWFTNLDHHKRNTPMLFQKQYSPQDYPTYDNYDAIEISKVANIPSDYYGLMGVPISFLDKYCPTQFEIVGSFNGGSPGEDLGATKSEIIQNGESKLWNGPIVNKKPLYKRIVIKRRTKC